MKINKNNIINVKYGLTQILSLYKGKNKIFEYNRIKIGNNEIIYKFSENADLNNLYLDREFFPNAYFDNEEIDGYVNIYFKDGTCKEFILNNNDIESDIKNYKLIDIDYIKIHYEENYDKIIFGNNMRNTVSEVYMDSKNIKDFSMLFKDFIYLNKISKLDTANANDMSYMFYNCSSLEKIDLSNFNNKNINDMSYMFYNCSSLKLLDLSTFISNENINVEHMLTNVICDVYVNEYEFLRTEEECDYDGKFNGKIQLLIDYEFYNDESSDCLPIININKENYIIKDTPLENNIIKREIYSKYILTSITFNGFDWLKNVNYIKITKNIKSLSGLFLNCHNLVNVYAKKWNTSNLNNVSYMFSGCISLEKIIGIEEWDTSNVESMRYMFNNCKLLKELDISKFDISKVNYIDYMFNNCEELSYLYLGKFENNIITNFSNMFNNCKKLYSINLENISSRPNITSYMFNNCESLIKINLDNILLKSLNYSEYMFNNCIKLKELDLSYKGNASSIVDCSYMFNNCKSLEYLDLTMTRLDSYMSSNYEKGNMSYMFSNCYNLKILDLTNFVFGSDIAVNHDGIFSSNNAEILLNSEKCKNDSILSWGIDVGHLIADYKYSSSINPDCLPTTIVLEKIDDRKFSNNNIRRKLYTKKELSSMNFENKLELLEVNYLRINKTVDIIINDKYMYVISIPRFKNCSNLIKVGKHCFEDVCTNYESNLDYLFYGCSSLEELDLSSFMPLANDVYINKPNDDRLSEARMNYAFYGCTKLKKLIIPLDTTKFNRFNYTFYGCSSLEELDLSSFTVKNDSNTQTNYMLDGVNCKVIIDNSKFLRNESKCYYNGKFTLKACDKLIADYDFMITKNNDFYDYFYKYNPFETSDSIFKIIDTTIDNGKKINRKIYIPKDSKILSVQFGLFFYNDINNNNNKVFTNYEHDYEVENNLLYNINYLKIENSITNLRNLFRNCISLKNININDCDTSNVTTMAYAFYKCKSLTLLDLTSFDVNNSTSTITTHMLQGISAIVKINPKKFFKKAYECDYSGTFERIE